MDWLTANDLMKSARNPGAGKPLENNTRLFDRGPRPVLRKNGTPRRKNGQIVYEDEPSFAVRLHGTDVVGIHPDGTFTISTGGWDTNTTWNRIYSYAPHIKQLYDRKLFEEHGRMFLRRPRPEDPEPEVPRAIIPPPFVARDPGPEPEWSPEGCWVGEVRTWVTIERVLLSWDGGVLGRDKLRPSDRPAPYYGEDHYPNRARAVLGFIDQMGLNDKIYSYMPVWREKFHVEKYVREMWHSYSYNSGDYSFPELPGQKKQCPHCAAFDARLRHWKLCMDGPSYGAGSRNGQGYRLYAEMMERFDGDVKAWDAERKRQWREKRDAKKVWREWVLRNAVSFFDGIIINSDGYAVRSEIEARDKRKRAEQRRIRRMERERQEARRLREIELAENERKFRELHGVEAETKPGAMQWIIDHGVKINA